MIFWFNMAVLNRWFGLAPCRFNFCLVLLLVVVFLCPRAWLTKGKCKGSDPFWESPGDQEIERPPTSFVSLFVLQRKNNIWCEAFGVQRTSTFRSLGSQGTMFHQSSMLSKGDTQLYSGGLAILWKLWLDNTEPTRANCQTCDIGTSRRMELVFDKKSLF